MGANTITGEEEIEPRDQAGAVWQDAAVAGFTRRRIIDVRLALNSRLQAMASELMDTAAKRLEQTGEKQRLFTTFDYAAGPRRRLRWVIVKAEHSVKGANPRFIVTNQTPGRRSTPSASNHNAFMQNPG